MAKQTGYLPPAWRAVLWRDYRITEKNLLDGAAYLPAALRKEFEKLWPKQEPDMRTIKRLAELHGIAEQRGKGRAA